MTGELNLAPLRGADVWARHAPAEHALRWGPLAGGLVLVALAPVLVLAGWHLVGHARATDGASDREQDLPSHAGETRDVVDRDSDESFPASDPPSWTATTTGAR